MLKKPDTEQEIADPVTQVFLRTTKLHHSKRDEERPPGQRQEPDALANPQRGSFMRYASITANGKRQEKEASLLE